MEKTIAKKNITTVKIYVDVIFFILMVLALIPQTTGIPMHEWAGFVIIVPVLFHLTVNWDWIVTNSCRIARNEANKAWFDYVLNWMLYLLMLVITISGIVISESVLPLFGIHFQPDRFWSVVHNLSATLFMAVLGIHIARHWKWIVAAFGKLKLKSDLHHLTEIKTIIQKYWRQLLLIIFASIVLSLLFWLIGSTEWAEGVRLGTATPESDQPENIVRSSMVYFLPLLKVSVIIMVSALATGGVMRIKQLINKAVSRSEHFSA